MTIRFSDHDWFRKRAGYDILVIRNRFVWFRTSLLRGPLQNRKSLAHQINNLFLVSSNKYTVIGVMCSLVTLLSGPQILWRFDEKCLVFRCEILKMAQNFRNRNSTAAHAAKYFRFSCYDSRTNSALEITWVIRVPNLVKIGEKLCPLALTTVERENFVTAKVGRRACAPNKSVLAVNAITLMRHLYGSLRSKFGEARLKIIEGARDYWLHWIRRDQSASDTTTHVRRSIRIILTHTRISSDFIVCPIPCTWIGQRKTVLACILFPLHTLKVKG